MVPGTAGASARVGAGQCRRDSPCSVKSRLVNDSLTPEAVPGRRLPSVHRPCHLAASRHDHTEREPRRRPRGWPRAQDWTRQEPHRGLPFVALPGDHPHPIFAKMPTSPQRTAVRARCVRSRMAGETPWAAWLRHAQVWAERWAGGGRWRPCRPGRWPSGAVRLGPLLRKRTRPESTLS